MPSHPPNIPLHKSRAKAGLATVMAKPTSTRTIRFVLLAIFSIVVLYKLFTSYPAQVHQTKPLPATPPLPDFPKDPAVTAIVNGIHMKAPQYVDHEKHTHLVNPKPLRIPGVDAPGERVKATFVTLARNDDLYDIAASIRQVEDRFNNKFHYDWVFLNDVEFNERFKRLTSTLVSGNASYGIIPKEHWSMPSWIDKVKAAKVREEMRKKKIIYGDSVSYRHMCRFESGFFYQHPIMKQYDYYWRVEPGIKLFCDIDFDPFLFMKKNNKKYGFVISLYEYGETIKSLWSTVKRFMAEHPEHIHPNNAMKFVSDDEGDTYNKCHYWSNFEIGDLNFFRGKAYGAYFDALDKEGGFFYERWGDAPVHSIAASILLDKDDIHFFDEIGYYHVPFTHCPTNEKDRTRLKCHCNPRENFDWKGYSCTNRHFESIGRMKPDGYENQMS